VGKAEVCLDPSHALSQVGSIRSVLLAPFTK
jgi:hypothetical protein